jgi:hypothetical protein
LEAKGARDAKWRRPATSQKGKGTTSGEERKMKREKKGKEKRTENSEETDQRTAAYIGEAGEFPQVPFFRPLPERRHLRALRKTERRMKLINKGKSQKHD